MFCASSGELCTMRQECMSHSAVPATRTEAGSFALQVRAPYNSWRLQQNCKRKEARSTKLHHTDEQRKLFNRVLFVSQLLKRNIEAITTSPAQLTRKHSSTEGGHEDKMGYGVCR